MEAGGLRLDPASRSCTRDGVAVELTAREFAVLEFLLRSAGSVVSKTDILENVWDYTFAGNASVLETYISYLRQKIDAVDPPLIHTVRGVGYSLRLPADHQER